MRCALSRYFACFWLDFGSRSSGIFLVHVVLVGPGSVVKLRLNTLLQLAGSSVSESQARSRHPGKASRSLSLIDVWSSDNRQRSDPFRNKVPVRRNYSPGIFASCARHPLLPTPSPSPSSSLSRSAAVVALVAPPLSNPALSDRTADHPRKASVVVLEYLAFTLRRRTSLPSFELR